MSLTLKVGDNDFEKLAVGTYLGTCFRMVDLGTQDTEYNGEKSKKKLIRLDFEITESLEPEGNEVNMEDGRPFGISRTYTASLFESANLRKELEEVREGFERDFHLNQCLPMENAFLFSCIKIDKLMLELQLRVDSIRSNYGCNEGYRVGYNEQWVEGYLND